MIPRFLRLSAETGKRANHPPAAALALPVGTSVLARRLGRRHCPPSRAFTDNRLATVRCVLYEAPTGNAGCQSNEHRQ